jgi:ubiquitin carboxyl-terminal hydrolase 4/11
MASSASSPPVFSALNNDIDAYMLDQDGQDLPLHATESFQQQDTTSTNLSTQQQFEVIKSLKRRALSSGDTWYIVSQVWYKRWEDACSGRLSKDSILSQRTIPPVDNTGIIDPGGDLRLDPPVAEGDSVEFVPEEAWTLFVKW